MPGINALAIGYAVNQISIAVQFTRTNAIDNKDACCQYRQTLGEFSMLIKSLEFIQVSDS